ncbi:MAG TPA: TetR/AcrR family transcriptional regulator [Verrucomicrobiae bacterium]|nr:TetR/AcrR family transcriptional regulator [Verrucomicrobiae bacterium]
MDAVLELIWTCSYGSTTIDQICDKAQVRKGSFYYYFDSKADLAAAAMEAQWEILRPQYDSMFSPTVAPLQRLRNYFELGYRFQRENKEKYGCVLGCPLFSLGAEISTQEHGLQKKVQEILAYKLKYLESAIRDAHAAGLVEAPDAASKARMILTYYEGLLTQARIQNDVEVLKEASEGAFAMLGLKTGTAAVA